MVTQPTTRQARTEPSGERFLPQNVEAEAGVLASLLINPDALTQIRDWLRAEHFASSGHQHGEIYRVICDLADVGMGADLLTVCDELQRRNLLDAVGGASYVSSLGNQAPTSANIETYAHIVERTALARRLIKVGAQIANIGYHDPDADAGLAQAERLIREVADGHAGLGGVGRLRLPDAPEMADAWMDSFTNRVATADARARGDLMAEDALGIPTGLRLMDNYLGGLERGKLITLAARPGHGKSALALTVALNAARAGYTVGLFSLEMTAQDVMTRALSLLSNVPHERLRQPTDVSDDEWTAITRGYEVYRALPLALDDERGLSVEDICARARRFTLQQGPLDVLMVDYLQIIAESRDSREGAGSGWRPQQRNRQQIIGQMTRALRELAGELDCCVVLLAQLSRAVEQRQDKRPQLSDLRESGDIENDSDAVLLLWRDDVHNPDSERPHLTDVIVAKNRAHKTGQFTLWFDEARVAFRSMTTLD